ncbi:hypothetical protein GIB67_015565 [Kingdonia uniflora]|uniref:Uncharacterized protein n=1 Tax=Kingdonia uniflora TaxID=39325 RepID=A0A7J7LU84_9MAGN|nr:hypothetical protein GIB67_015565 [Kingdonia uniflora]
MSTTKDTGSGKGLPTTKVGGPLRHNSFPDPEPEYRGYPETNGRGLNPRMFGPLVDDDDVPQSNNSFETIRSDVPSSNELSNPQSNVHHSNESMLTNIPLSNTFFETIPTDVPLSNEPKLTNVRLSIEPEPIIVQIEPSVVNKFNLKHVLSNEYKIVTEDPTKRKGITMRWEKLCKPFNDGGLGIRSLREVNNVMLCKLNWMLNQREETWAQLLHIKFHTISGKRIQYHKRFSIWQGIKHAEGITKPFIGWIIKKGMKIDFWRDSWASDILLREHIDLPRHLWKKCTVRVSNFINVDGWNLPPDISLAFLAMGIDITNIPCNPSVEDIQIWKPEVHGKFSVKNVFVYTRKRLDTAWW